MFRYEPPVVETPILRMIAVGIDQFASPDIPRLANSAADASGVLDIMRSDQKHEVYGEVDSILLTDEKATLDNIEHAFDDMAERVPRRDWLPPRRSSVALSTLLLDASAWLAAIEPDEAHHASARRLLAGASEGAFEVDGLEARGFPGRVVTEEDSNRRGKPGRRKGLGKLLPFRGNSPIPG